MFQNRSRAGQALAKMLLPYKKENAIILGIPRGGVPVAYEIASLLKKPLGIVLVKKIGHPMNKEYAIGAVSLEDEIINPDHKTSNAYVEDEIKAVRQRLLLMKKTFMGRDYTSFELKGKMVIIVDDGLATGYTMINTIRLIKRCNPFKIIVAVPVAPKETIDEIKKEGITIVVIEIPYFFNGIGAFYEDFSQVENEDVLAILEKHQAETQNFNYWPRYQ
jgi:putative phosphoribosyl transferase